MVQRKIGGAAREYGTAKPTLPTRWRFAPSLGRDYRRGTRNGSIACTQGAVNRSSDRLSCTAATSCPSSRVSITRAGVERRVLQRLPQPAACCRRRRGCGAACASSVGGSVARGGGVERARRRRRASTRSASDCSPPLAPARVVEDRGAVAQSARGTSPSATKSSSSGRVALVAVEIAGAGPAQRRASSATSTRRDRRDRRPAVPPGVVEREARRRSARRDARAPCRAAARAGARVTSSMSITRHSPSQCSALGPMREVVGVAVQRGPAALRHRPAPRPCRTARRSARNGAADRRRRAGGPRRRTARTRCR